jgi:hypothetical protein
VFRRSADGTVSLLVAASADSVLGLEIAPPTGFGSFGGQLVATTSAGEVLVIDSLSPNPPAEITPSQTLHQLSDLVFASNGTLYAVENGGSSPRLLTIAADGTVVPLNTGPGQLGNPDGIEIDEGGKRLLVTSYRFPSADRLLAVALSNAQVSQLATIDIDFGIYPTGIVYDRLGTVVVHGGGNTSTSLDAVSIYP